MLTTIAVIFRIFSNSVANLYQKKSSEIISPLTVNLVSYFIMSCMCLYFAVQVDWTQYNTVFWGSVILAGILCTVGTLSLIEALRIGELSVLAPINSYKSVIGLLGAFILLGELPTIKEFVCVLFIILGSYCVLDTDEKRFSIKTFLRRDIRLRIFALVCSGLEASVLKKIILLSSYKISLILWCFSGFICSLFICLFYSGNLESKTLLNKSSLKYCFIVAVSLLIMQLSTNYVFSKLPVAPALALFQLSSLVSLYFGYKVYHEKHILKKLLGTIIMICSAVVILYD